MKGYYREQKLKETRFATWEEYLEFKRKNNKTRNRKDYYTIRSARETYGIDFQSVEEIKEWKDKNLVSRVEKIKSELDLQNRINEFNKIKDTIKIHPTMTDYGLDAEYRIWNIKTFRILKIYKNEYTGYMQCHLQKKMLFHKFVWECHKGLLERDYNGQGEDITIAHLDDNKENNRIDNLCLKSKHDNVRDAKTNTLPYGLSYGPREDSYRPQFSKDGVVYNTRHIGLKSVFYNLQDAIVAKNLLKQWLDTGKVLIPKDFLKKYKTTKKGT